MTELNAGYPIVIGDSIMSELGAFIEKNFPMHAVVILVDENTEEHCLPNFNWSDCEQVLNAEVLSVPPGESSKSLEILEQLALGMLDIQMNRNTLLLNLGGGVICDLGGFLASTFKRGIPYINVPTSLLAMVDASCGGKTAVNLGSVKNQIGSFYFPEAVFCGLEFLETLPSIELDSGRAEMIKHQLISGAQGAPFWPEINEAGVASSIEVKKQIVEIDPKENSDRKKLNLGHTVAHAFESISHLKHNPITHGHAVALGLLVEMKIAVDTLGFDVDLLNEMQELVFSHYEPLALDMKHDEAALTELMQADKKNDSNQINFTLLKGRGEVLIDQKIGAESISEALTWYANLM